MENNTLDTRIQNYGEFGSVIVTPGEQVFLYRRLKDAHDPALVAVVNEVNEAIGYLDAEVAESVILPALKEGARFQCIVTGEPVDDTVPIAITSVSQSEVSEILNRRGIRRTSASGMPPLAGLFDESVDDDDDEDGPLEDDDDDLDLDDDEDDEGDKPFEEE